MKNSESPASKNSSIRDLGGLVHIPKKPGTYLLLLEVSHPMTLRVGCLGNVFFNNSNHLYVGSALGKSGLRARISRHLHNKKKIFWHIDYLLQHARVKAVYFIVSNQKLECKIARALITRGIEFVEGFGSSDCNCESHLFVISNVRDIEKILRELNLKYSIVTIGEIS
ncbi:MAG: GIY-YIG nuclease family protein [Candidatus Korarchaeota archaeon]